jgi:hypothetical protein
MLIRTTRSPFQFGVCDAPGVGETARILHPVRQIFVHFSASVGVRSSKLVERARGTDDYNERKSDCLRGLDISANRGRSGGSAVVRGK